MIDSGAAKALPAIVKAAVAVPPPVVITPGGTAVPAGPMTSPPQVPPQGQPGAQGADMGGQTAGQAQDDVVDADYEVVDDDK